MSKSDKERLKHITKYSIYFYLILTTFSFFIPLDKHNLKHLFSILLLSHILLLYIATFPVFKYISYFYLINSILTLFFFRNIFVNFNYTDFIYLLLFFIVMCSTFYFKIILYKVRISDTIKNIAPRLKPLIEARFEIEDKVSSLRKENLDLEFRKMNINKIYNQIKIINSTLQLDDMMEVSKKILTDVIGLNNFVFFLRDEKKEYNQFLECEIDDEMKEYLSTFFKKKGENFFDKINSHVKFTIEQEKKQTSLKNINIFPLVLKEEILGMLLQFEKKQGNIDDVIINNIKIVIRYISMGIKKALLYNKVQELSQKDGLTSLYIRRVFNHFLDEEFLRSKRYKSKLCLIIFDIDFFKKVNDKYGHLFGDKVLNIISKCMLDNIKLPLSASRYGGEEFVIICPNTTKKQAFELAEKIRLEIENYKFMFNKRVVNITISGGIAELTSYMKSASILLKKTDDNLYKAKNSGRNKVFK